MSAMPHIWVRRATDGVYGAIPQYRCVRCYVIRETRRPDPDDALRETPPCSRLQSQIIREHHARRHTNCVECHRERGRGHTGELKCLFGAGSFRIRYCTRCSLPHRLFYAGGYRPDCMCVAPSEEYP